VFVSSFVLLVDTEIRSYVSSDLCMLLTPEEFALPLGSSQKTAPSFRSMSDRRSGTHSPPWLLLTGFETRCPASRYCTQQGRLFSFPHTRKHCHLQAHCFLFYSVCISASVLHDHSCGVPQCHRGVVYCASKRAGETRAGGWDCAGVGAIN
jgi:hypothetical protein